MGTIYPVVSFMPYLIIFFLAILHGAAFTLSPAWADPAPPGPRITTPTPVKASPLSALARQLMSADQDLQWEFAAIALDVLLDVYTTELQGSAGEKASTSARRAKLARWQRATRGLIDQIELARLELAQGGRFSLYVDPRHQILIIVEGHTVVVSGPHASAEDRISSPVLEQFCAYNDCSILHEVPSQAAEAEANLGGIWVLRQGYDPSYRLDGGIHCEFDTLEHGDRKAAVCKRLADELFRLAAALRQAVDQGQAIDWEHLLNSAPDTTKSYIVLNETGAYLEIELDLLGKAEKEDWRDMLIWLRDETEDRPSQPALIRAGRFLQE